MIIVMLNVEKLFQCSLQVIAPWKMPEFFERFQGRLDLFEYAKVILDLSCRSMFPHLLP